MSNPTVSFRISNYHLARGLRAIRTLEPNWQLTTPGELIRTIFNDYIAKSEHKNKTPLETGPDLIQEIALCRLGRTSQPTIKPLPHIGQIKPPTPRELEEERIFNEVKQEYQESQAAQKTQAGQEKLAIQKAEQRELADKQIQDQISSAFPSTKPRIKPSEFHDPNITESTISTVTDFSPPKEWIENITKS